MPTGEDFAQRKIRKTSEESEGEPPCRVFILNDDFTPMEFVVHILAAVFLLPSLNAVQIMVAGHLNGKAYVQTLPRAEARRRIGKACFAARLQAFPLEFSMEAE